MRVLKSKKSRVAVATVAIFLLGGGAAFAFWTSSGTGVGAGQTGTSTAFVVASSAATGGPLTPGGATQTVAFTVTNPSTGVQHLTSVVVTVAEAGGTLWNDVPGCAAADYTVGTPSITYADIAPGGVANGTVTLAMNNLVTNQDACKLAVVPLYFVAS